MGLLSMFKTLRAVRHLSTGGAMQQAVSELCVPVPWGQIRGQVWGPDHGRPVLCLHGWSDNCGSFKNLIPLLPKECKYVAMDMAGHGLSSHRPDGVFYMFSSYVADVYRVIDALQWKRFSIIGHSMGGNVASLFSALYPEMVERLVVLDLFGFFPTEVEKIPELMRKGIDEMVQYDKKKGERAERVYTYEKAVERLRAANPFLSEQSARILLERGSTEVEGGVVFNRDFRINLTNITRLTLMQAFEMLSRTQAQIHLVMASNGIRRSLSEPMKQVCDELLKAYADKGASVVTVAGDHHVHLNHPEAVAQLLTDYLQRGAVTRADGPATGMDAAKLG
ncbi:serine hydrolase-like protein isoform X3 [Anguilla rostrata]|uniref:serine hydrolase-like protein isoform X3 n=1 Tax=Anguilla rostrata TaxID=7938 RepID=UPI0030CE2571